MSERHLSATQKLSYKEKAFTLLHSVLFLICLIGIPITAHIYRSSPTVLFASTAAVYAVFGGIYFVTIQIALSKLEATSPNFGKIYHVVGPVRIALNIVLAMAFFAALTWLQAFLGALRFPRLTYALFWGFHLGMIGSPVFLANMVDFFLPKPRAYVDYPAYAETLVSLTGWASMFVAYSAICLVLLAAWSIGLTLWTGRKN